LGTLADHRALKHFPTLDISDHQVCLFCTPGKYGGDLTTSRIGIDIQLRLPFRDPFPVRTGSRSQVYFQGITTGRTVRIVIAINPSIPGACRYGIIDRFRRSASVLGNGYLCSRTDNLLSNDLNVIVYNFVDMLSHARTEMEVLKELAGDEVSYRSITASWFEHSPLHQALKKIADKNIKIVLATDHGSVRVKTPVKVIGDKQTTTSLRYKHGRNLNYDPKEVMAFRDPKEGGLPSPTINSSYIFAGEDAFLCYPNNYNHYVNYYRNTFQHGGISLEEMIVPVIQMVSK